MPRRGVKVSLRRSATLTPLSGSCWSGSRPTAKGWPLDLGLRDGSFNYLEDKKRLDQGTYIEAVSNAHTILASEFNPKNQSVIQSAVDGEARHKQHG